MKIAIYGAGAMGTVLGAFLTEKVENKHVVHLISRNKSHVDGLNASGAEIDCVADGITKKLPVKALLPDEMDSDYDIIFLMTKQRENVSIVSVLKNKLNATGVICTTQNGYPEENISKIVGANKTYGCVCRFGANLIGEGKVQLTSNISALSVTVGSYDNSNTYLEGIKDVLSEISPNFVEITDNLKGARWSKLALNSAFSGLSVITGLKFGELAKKNKSSSVAVELLRECFSVAKSAGIKLEKTNGHDLEKLLGKKGIFGKLFAKMLLPIAMKSHKELVSGMLLDLQKGRKCEIDYICGVVQRMGKEYGVKTPYTDKVIEITHGIENGLYELSENNLEFFS